MGVMSRGQEAVAAYVANREEFYTTQFEKEEVKMPEKVSLIKKGADNIANICGTYFEVCVYEAFEKIEGVSITGEGLSEHQKKIKEVFNTKKTQVIVEQKAAIEQGALTAVKTWCKNFKERIEKEGLTIEMTADIIGRNGKTYGNPFGDLLAKIGDEKISLELKWQMNIDNEIKYFHQVSEYTLFKNGFKQYLEDNFQTYWNHNKKRREWTEDISTTALINFLNEKFGNDAQSIIRYLLHKGEMRFTRSKSDYNSKYVIRGTSVSIQIANIEALGEALGSGGSLGDTGSRIFSAGRSRTTGVDGEKVTTFDVVKNLGVIGFYMQNGEEVARFGMKKFTAGRSGLFSGRATSESSRKGYEVVREEVAKKAIDQASFAYHMSISSKLFDNLFLG